MQVMKDKCRQRGLTWALLSFVHHLYSMCCCVVLQPSFIVMCSLLNLPEFLVLHLEAVRLRFIYSIVLILMSQVAAALDFSNGEEFLHALMHLITTKACAHHICSTTTITVSCLGPTMWGRLHEFFFPIMLH
ncbi:hypothetical protein KFK09_000319 [Dendrobium nobile]|uniref:Uncharacterized protein n=1 Tax=Dendrobium nobile TaxID=94219 RepID=A0A8T3C8J3_DENNO|nr:hypothetical protein KFK09_000319 [Dendrobium nobile]